MAQASDDGVSDAISISDVVHSNANVDIQGETCSKESDSKLKIVLQAVVESHNKILASQIITRIDEFEKKMHACWSSLQEQIVEQQHKSSLQDERFERFESALLNHSSSIQAVVKELTGLRGDIKQAASATSRFTNEAQADDPHIHELVEHDALLESWEAQYITEFEDDSERQRHSTGCSTVATGPASPAKVKLEDYQNLPIPTKLFVNSGDTATSPQSQFAEPYEGSMSEMSCFSHQAGEAFVEGALSSDVELLRSQNLHQDNGADDPLEWSYWSTEPKEQLAIASDASSVSQMDHVSTRGSSGVQGPSDSSSTSTHPSGARSDRNLRIGVDDVRTVMIKNIPCRYSNQDMLDVFKELGFGNEPIFFHLPSRYKQDSNLGYAFVGFNSKETTARFAEAMTGYRFKHSSSRKTCVVTPAHIQGMRKNVNHFSQGRKYNPPRLSM